MHELLFADTAIPATVECLGVPLRPYSIAHELALLRYRSPFLCSTRAEFDAMDMALQIQAIRFAVQVCSGGNVGRFWRWKTRNADYSLAIAEFRNYIANGRNFMPTLSSADKYDQEAYEIANKGEKLDGGRSLGAPLIANLIHYCLSDLHLSYTETLQSPFAYVGNLYFAQLESKGSLHIENHKEAEARAEMTKQRAEVKAERDLAVSAWNNAKTDEEKAEAYAKYPRIGNLFAEEWNAATDEATKAAIEAKWGAVAQAELAASGLKGDVCPV